MEQKHPKGLYLLVMVEIWERFNYYGMRALLVLYMTGILMFSVEKASKIYGAYTSAVYLTPLLGGYLADKFLGRRRAVFIGMGMMALGQLVMSSSSALPFFFSALVLIALGNGFFKPNMATMIGDLYPDKTDPRRDGGYTLFYMGVNVGAFFAPLVCGYFGEKIGYKYGFLAAACGMIIGIITLALGQKKLLGDIGLHSNQIKSDKPAAAKSDAPLTKEEKQKIAVLFIMAFFVVFFWAAFEQAGSSMTLFAKNETNRMIFGWEMPASYFQAINPLFIVIFGGIFSNMWIRLSKVNMNPTTPMKFVMGLVLLGGGFIVMAFAAHFAGAGKVSMLWLTMAYWMNTMGELCLSPVGLSLVSKLAPVKFAALLMGCWYLSRVASNWIAGVFAGNYDTMNHVKFYMLPVFTAWGAAAVLLIFAKKIKKWMHEVH